MLNAATVYTFDVNGKSSFGKRYWTWNEMKKQRVAFDEACEEVWRLLKRAVRLRRSENEQSILALSGGLDSRSILAASEDREKLRAFTFGKKMGDDVVLATKLAGEFGMHHSYLEINEENWLNGKIAAIWRTDGMMPFFHLHSVTHYFSSRKFR